MSFVLNHRVKESKLNSQKGEDEANQSGYGRRLYAILYENKILEGLANKMSPNTHINKNSPYSVLLIAEEGVVNTNLVDVLTKTQDIELVANTTNGVDGVSAARKRHIDVFIIDIGMRNEDPLVTLKRILRIDEHAKIVMASTLSFNNVRRSMKGFERGAAELINTPASFTQKKSALEFKSETLRIVRSLGDARRQDSPRSAPEPLVSRATAPAPKDITLRRASSMRPKVLAIGSSTGGPQALLAVIEGLPKNIPVPVFVTQHMPKTFTAALAASISKSTGKTVVEGKDEMQALPGTIYIAPGDFHMTIGGSSTTPVISLNQEPKVNFCRPSADPMIESIVNLYGGNTLLTILTGMGADGKKGAELVVEAKGTVIAQDFETSVVWGMPGAVAMAGLCSQVLPIGNIPMAINKLINP